MTEEELEEIKQLAEERLRVGDILAAPVLALLLELEQAQAEITRLRRLLGEIP